MTVLLLGAGPMATAYAKVLQAHGVALTCVGRGEASAARFEAETGVTVRRGGLDCLVGEVSERNLAIVALPIPMLAEAVRRLVRLGFRRILVEKPAGLDAAEIRSLAAEVGSSADTIFVAYNRRFYASVVAARSIIAEDGGVTSFHFDFSELVPRILTPDKTPEVLANWFWGNATHVVDMAFHLGGEPERLIGDAIGRLDWHAPAIFTGHGRTRSGALFTYHADWTSPGRWGLEVRTRRHRLVFQPLEHLKAQRLTGFALEDIAIDDGFDREFKPGLYRQVAAFLSRSPQSCALLSLSEHARRIPAFEALRTGLSWQEQDENKPNRIQGAAHVGGE